MKFIIVTLIVCAAFLFLLWKLTHFEGTFEWTFHLRPHSGKRIDWDKLVLLFGGVFLLCGMIWVWNKL